MPTYCYSDGKKTIEVIHEMRFVGNEKELPKEILKQITRKDGTLMERVPQIPILKGSSQGTFKTEKQLLSEKQAQRKLRSKIHFKNEELPKLRGTPGEKRHFANKLKNLPKTDHEKL